MNSSNKNLLDSEKAKYKESIEKIYKDGLTQCEMYTQSLKSNDIIIFRYRIEKIALDQAFPGKYGRNSKFDRRKTQQTRGYLGNFPT